MSAEEISDDEDKAKAVKKIDRAAAATALASIDPPHDGAEEKEAKLWEARGTILGLSIELGMIIWLQSMPLATMFIYSMVSYGKMFPCQVGGSYNLTFVDACFCAYTKAHVRCFAPLALSAFCLIILRDLVQKRLYYWTLKHHGVIEFGSNNPLKDYIFIAVAISFVHIILHLLFIVYATGFLTGGPSNGFLQHSDEALLGDAYAFRIIVELVTLSVLPAVLFMIFFFCGYDMEATLVPLSQYVHDARDAGEQEELSQLEILEDCWVKEILDTKTGEVLALAENHLDEFKCLQQEYNKNRVELEKKETYKIGLKDSLWASRLLLPAEATQDPAAKGFRVMWMVFFVTAMVFQFLVIWLVLHYVLRDMIKSLEGHIPDTISMGVEFVMFLGCLLIWSRMVVAHRRSRSIEVPRPPDEEKGGKKD